MPQAYDQKRTGQYQGYYHVQNGIQHHAVFRGEEFAIHNAGTDVPVNGRPRYLRREVDRSMLTMQFNIVPFNILSSGSDYPVLETTND